MQSEHYFIHKLQKQTYINVNFALLEPTAMVKVLNVQNVQLEPIQTKVVYHLAPLAQTFVLVFPTIQQVVAQKMNVLGVVMLALFTHLAMLGVVAMNLLPQTITPHHQKHVKEKPFAEVILEHFYGQLEAVLAHLLVQKNVLNTTKQSPPLRGIFYTCKKKRIVIIYKT